MRQPAEWQSVAAEAAAAAAEGPAAADLPPLCPAPRPGRLLQDPCLAAARCNARNSQEKQSYCDPTSAQQYVMRRLSLVLHKATRQQMKSKVDVPESVL